MLKRYIHHSDPDHGWLGVPLSDLLTLGVAEQISGYSYREGDVAYLEEDRDAGIFLRAARAAGWQVEQDTSYVPGFSFVWNLPTFEP